MVLDWGGCTIDQPEHKNSIDAERELGSEPRETQSSSQQQLEEPSHSDNQRLAFIDQGDSDGLTHCVEILYFLVHEQIMNRYSLRCAKRYQKNVW